VSFLLETERGSQLRDGMQYLSSTPEKVRVREPRFQ
jgi:hypothetical protein